MIDWEWTRETIEPDDVLDAVKTVQDSGHSRQFVHLTWRWTQARVLLSWAAKALQWGDYPGWDAASTWAKRAVCRQMDSILAHNHLSFYLGCSYEKKSKWLAVLKVPGLSLLRGLVIDPRNDIEHAYTVATEEKAKQAYEVAELFLGATDVMAQELAVIGRGMPFASYAMFPGPDGNPKHSLHFNIKREHGPMLLIDYYRADPILFLLIPTDRTLRSCLLKGLDPEQLLALNAHLKDLKKEGSFIVNTLNEDMMDQVTKHNKL